MARIDTLRLLAAALVFSVTLAAGSETSAQGVVASSVNTAASPMSLDQDRQGPLVQTSSDPIPPRSVERISLGAGFGMGYSGGGLTPSFSEVELDNLGPLRTPSFDVRAILWTNQRISWAVAVDVRKWNGVRSGNAFDNFVVTSTTTETLSERAVQVNVDFLTGVVHARSADYVFGMGTAFHSLDGSFTRETVSTFLPFYRNRLERSVNDYSGLNPAVTFFAGYEPRVAERVSLMFTARVAVRPGDEDTSPCECTDPLSWSSFSMGARFRVGPLR